VYVFRKFSGRPVSAVPIPERQHLNPLHIHRRCRSSIRTDIQRCGTDSGATTDMQETLHGLDGPLNCCLLGGSMHPTLSGASHEVFIFAPITCSTLKCCSRPRGLEEREGATIGSMPPCIRSCIIYCLPFPPYYTSSPGKPYSSRMYIFFRVSHVPHGT
jgi:hypothetical protein